MAATEAKIKKWDRDYRSDVAKDARLLARIASYDNSTTEELEKLHRSLTGALKRLDVFLEWRRDPSRFHPNFNPYGKG